MRYTSPTPLSDSVGSNLLANSALVAAIASAYGVNKNDLVLTNYTGQAYPVQNTSYVGAANGVGGANTGNQLVPVTALQTGTSSDFDTKQSSLFLADQGSTLMAIPNGTSGAGIKLVKYSNTGALQASVLIDGGGITGGYNLLQLSNGNIVIIWSSQAASQAFAIVDSSLNIIVAKTIFGAVPSVISKINAKALPGGGFAVAYVSGAAVGAFFAVYSNTGAVVSAPAAVSGSPTSNVYVRMALLSNGNIAVAMTSNAAGGALYHAIFTIAGSQVLVATLLDNGTKGSPGFPDISAMNGFYAISFNLGATIKAYVLNNAGTQQGTAFSAVVQNQNHQTRIQNDGVAFWLVWQRNANYGAAYLPVTGAANAVDNTTSIQGDAVPDMYIERGHAFVIGGFISSLALRANGTTSLAASFSNPASGLEINGRLLSDFSVLILPTNGNISFAVCRLMDIAIIGVSRNTVAVGVSGTLIQIAAGPVGMPINPLPGIPSKAFDHSAATIAGNKGIVWNYSGILKGF